MSGGAFNYLQYHITQIREDIEKELEQQGTEKKDKFGMSDYYEKYPEQKFHIIYREDIQEKFKEAVKALKIAEVYVHEIDWYLSGDTGEDSFLKRLKEKLDKLC